MLTCHMLWDAFPESFHHRKQGFFRAESFLKCLGSQNGDRVENVGGTGGGVGEREKRNVPARK